MKYFKLGDKLKELNNVRNNSTTKGFSTGFKPLDDIWSLKKGYPLFWGGEPASGKSEIIMDILMNTAVLHGWKHFVYLGEAGEIEEAIADLAFKYICKPYKKRDGFEMSETERIQAEMFIENHFFFVDDEADLTVEQFYKLANQAEKEMSVKFDTTLFDPFYDFIDESKEYGGLHGFVNYALKYARKSSKENNRIDIIINHVSDIPTEKDKDSNKYFKRPAKSDEWYGGKNWSRRAFSQMLSYIPQEWMRDDNGMEYGQNTSLIIVQKAKPKGIGIKGGVALLKWDWKYNRYYWEENGVRKFAFMINAPKDLKEPKMKPNLNFSESNKLNDEGVIF